MENLKLFEKVLAQSQDNEKMTAEENQKENLQLMETESILEMSVLRKFETGLPVNIWVDEGNSYLQSDHSKRIKIQPDKSEHPNSRYMIPICISDDPQIMVKNPNLHLSQYDIDLIKEFIKLNKDLLLNLNKIGIVEFSKQMKKVNN